VGPEGGGGLRRQFPLAVKWPPGDGPQERKNCRKDTEKQKNRPQQSPKESKKKRCHRPPLAEVRPPVKGPPTVKKCCHPVDQIPKIAARINHPSAPAHAVKTTTAIR
jgi:hypothetical protein